MQSNEIDTAKLLARINQSLTAIDYNPGRFIRLEEQAAPDADVRDVQGELRACTEGGLAGSDDPQYFEVKFLEVETIIKRFKGREGLTEVDGRWTVKVTDRRALTGCPLPHRSAGVRTAPATSTIRTAVVRAAAKRKISPTLERCAL